MAKYVFVVFSNPTPGKEAEFNEWYNKHLADVLKVPGFVAAERFSLAGAQFGGRTDHPYRYMALYEIETDDVGASIRELEKRLGTAEMPVSDAIDLKHVEAITLAAIPGSALAKDAARAKRAS